MMKGILTVPVGSISSSVRLGPVALHHYQSRIRANDRHHARAGLPFSAPFSKSRLASLRRGHLDQPRRSSDLARPAASGGFSFGHGGAPVTGERQKRIATSRLLRRLTVWWPRVPVSGWPDEKGRVGPCVLSQAGAMIRPNYKYSDRKRRAS